MALDPRIALETMPVDANLGPAYAAGVDIAKKKADIGQVQANTSQTQQQTQNLAAQQGGLQAASDIAKKNADYEKWLSENADKHTDTLEDGTKVSNGFKLMGAAKNAGFYGQAQGAIEKDLTNISKGIKNASDQQTAVQVAAGYLGQMLDGMPEKEQAQLYSLYKNKLDAIMPAQTPGGVGGGTMLGPWSPGKIKALKQMSMSPEAAQGLTNVQTQLGQGQQSLDQAAVVNMSGPEAANPKSTASVNARSSLKKLGIDVPETMSYSDMKNNPRYANMIDQQVNPATNRAAQQGQAIASEKDAAFWDSAAETAKAVKIPEQIKNLRLSDFLAGKYDTKLISDTDRDALTAKIAEAKARGLDVDAITTNVGGIGKIFTNQAIIARKQGQASAASANSGTFNAGTPTGNAGTKVRMKSADGSKEYDVPADMVNAAMAKGLIKVK